MVSMNQKELECYNKGRYDQRVEDLEDQSAAWWASDLTTPDIMNISTSRLKSEKLGIAFGGLNIAYNMFLDEVRDNNFKNNNHGWFNKHLIDFFGIEPEKLLVAEDEYVWMSKFIRLFVKELKRANLVADIKFRVNDFMGEEKQMIVSCKTWVLENIDKNVKKSNRS